MTAVGPPLLLLFSIPYLRKHEDSQGMGGACPSSPPLPPPSQAGEDRRPPSSVHCPWLLPPWPPPLAKFEDPKVTSRRVAGGGGGAVEGERKRKKGNKVACMHVKLPPFNHFQSKIKY